MVLSVNIEKARVTLSTKKLEKRKGDMMRNKQLVFDGADGGRMAGTQRPRKEAQGG